MRVAERERFNTARDKGLRGGGGGGASRAGAPVPAAPATAAFLPPFRIVFLRPSKRAVTT